MNELEGTWEFNRSFRAITSDLNGASLDPKLGRSIYEPRQYDEHNWTEQEAGIAFTEEFLEGQEYHPAPEIIPDTQTGFSMDGNYHAVEHFTTEGLANAITPYRWASYLQDALEQYISTSDYTVGKAERDDIVQDIVAERMEALDDMREKWQLEEALEMWRRIYGS